MKVSKHCRDDAILTTTYLINKMPTNALKHQVSKQLATKSSSVYPMFVSINISLENWILELLSVFP